MSEVNDIWQVDNEFTYQGNPNTYSWFVRVDVINDNKKVGPDMLRFGLLRETALLPLQLDDVVFRCIRATQLFPTKSLPLLDITGITGTRTPLGNQLPGQCSLVVTLYGDPEDPTRHNRGRDFWTGLNGGDQTDGFWIGATLSEFADMYVAMTNVFSPAASGNQFSIGLYSATQSKKTIPVGDPPVAPDPDAIFFWPLQLVRARAAVRTQRRRQALDPCEFFQENVVTDTP